MMKQEPVDYRNPLGISKREWTKVLGVNLALLLIVYTVALITTLSGNDFFLLKFTNPYLQQVETTLRGWGIFALVQIAFETLEATIIAMFVAKGKIKFWIPFALYGVYVLTNVLFTQTLGYLPPVAQFVNTAVFLVLIAVFYNSKSKRELGMGFVRLAIGVALSLGLNAIINALRTRALDLWNLEIPNSAIFALNMEYDIALVLSFLFISLLLELRQKGEQACPTTPPAGGSSPTLTNSLPKNSPSAKNPSNLSPKIKKHLKIMRAKVFAIQTVAFIVIAFFPWLVGRPVEFAIVYASFCLTRLTLGFSRSLHFKSELVCVTAGAITFWLLTLLTPSVEACLIMSMVYGAATALGFRLYWELHDLILYRRASKMDRYAMFYTAFKGDISRRHIFGVMMAKGYGRDEIEMVQLYMERMKVEAIAIEKNYSKRSIETRLTDIATDLYERR